MIKIWTYNLSTFKICEVEVDEIRSPKLAVKLRSQEGKLKAGESANISYKSFSPFKEEAEEKVRVALLKEIRLRVERLKPLVDQYNSIEEMPMLKLPFIPTF